MPTGQHSILQLPESWCWKKLTWGCWPGRAQPGWVWLSVQGSARAEQPSILHPEVLLHLQPRSPAQAGMLGWEVSTRNKQIQVLHSDQKGMKNSPHSQFLTEHHFTKSSEIGPFASSSVVVPEIRSFPLCIIINKGQKSSNRWLVTFRSEPTRDSLIKAV